MGFEPFLYLLLFFYGMVLLAAPFWMIALSAQASRLRRQLQEHKEESARERAKLQRAIGELQTKLAAPPQAPAPASGEKPTAVPAPAAASPSTITVPPSPTRVPVPRYFPEVLTPPSPVAPPAKTPPSAQPDTPAAAKPPSPPAPAATLETKPPAPPAPAEAKPAASAPPAGPPTTPLAPEPASVATPPKVVVPRPALHPQPMVPPAPAARVSSPATTSPLGSSAPPALQQRFKSLSSIEETLGTSWFAILGVVLLVIGLALLGKLAMQNLGPFGKSVILFVVSSGLLAAGISLEKRERYQALGRVAIGGGWALLFFSTFGIHYVPAMRILDTAVVDCALMLFVAVAMGAHTLRYRSQFVTGIAFLLGYTTVALSEDTVYSLTAGVMLAIGLVAIVLKMGWFELEVFGILCTYLNHLYWLYRLPGIGLAGAHGRIFPEYYASLSLLFVYWLTFRISYVMRAIKTDFEEHVSTVAAILNTLLLLGLMKFQSVNPDLAYLGLFAVGMLEFSFAQLPLTRQRRRAFVLLTVLGAALMLAAVPSHYTGDKVAILWLVGAEVFLAAGIIFEEVVFLRLGLFTGILVGVDLVGFNFRPLMELRAKSEGLDLVSGVLFALCALVFYANALYVRSRWEKSFAAAVDSGVLTMQSYVGAFSAATAAWALCSYDWTAVALAAIMLALAGLNKRLAQRHLQLQYALIGILALYRTLVFNLHLDSPSHIHIQTRLITLPILGALFYATAKLAMLRDDQEQRAFRALLSFGGAAVFGFLIWFEAPQLWIASLFLAAGVMLALAARRWSLVHLTLQEHVFALLAFAQTLAYNFHAPGHYGPFTLRLLTVGLVAAGLYAISRRATLADAAHAIPVAYLHTTGATFLLALLMYYEVDPGSGWLAALWALFALVLTLIDRRFRMNDLRWQAHALAALTMVRCVAVNVYDHSEWQGISVRLITLAIVAAIFYGMALLIRMPEEWRARDFHHIYSWAASFLASLLLWYELDALGRAVGLAAFGLVLFEYGFLRKIAQFRYQAYVAFFAAFARIFFANLTAGEPGELFGPRMYTVLPLILIFFFVYAQLSGAEEGSSASAIRFRSDALVAYLGTTSLAALCYFQFNPEWVVVAFAAMAFALLGAAWGTKREIFLHQGIILTLATLGRGMAHNLFGSSYFTNGDWRGRYLVVSVAVATLMAALFFAFPLREEFNSRARTARRSRSAELTAGHPEQFVFFASVILVTAMLALKTTETLLTISWGVEGLCIVVLAFALNKERNFRWTGVALLLLCVAKVSAMDFWRFDLAHKVITCIGLGLAVIATALLYMRFIKRQQL